MSAELIKTPIDASPTIRKAAETNTDYVFSPTLRRLNHYGDIITENLFPRFDGLETAKALIAIAAMRINTLAALRIVPDDYALKGKLTMNEKYYRPADELEIQNGLEGMVWVFGQWGELETLTHELCHWDEENRGIPYHPGRSAHTQQFVDNLEKLGIHSELHTGIHKAPAELDKPFGLLMKRLGIQRPELPPEQAPEPGIDWWRIFFGDERKGKSSLTMWACAMCGFKVRVGIKGDPQLIHGADGGSFVRG